MTSLSFKFKFKFEYNGEYSFFDSIVFLGEIYLCSLFFSVLFKPLLLLDVIIPSSISLLKLLLLLVPIYLDKSMMTSFMKKFDSIFLILKFLLLAV